MKKIIYIVVFVFSASLSAESVIHGIIPFRSIIPLKKLNRFGLVAKNSILKMIVRLECLAMLANLFMFNQ